MKILIFSDCHLSIPFDEKKYKFLKKIISQTDKVILNGDFWDGSHITFEAFVTSPWKKLFPLLKEKKAVYVYGNHDRQAFSDERVSLFSDIQGPRFEIMIDDRLYIFEHGNRIFPYSDDIFHNKKPTPAKITKFLDSIERLMIRHCRSIYFYLTFRNVNQTMKKRLTKELLPHHIFICGHSHFAEIDLDKQFANSGLIKHGLGQYLMIEDGKIMKYEEWYDK